MSFYNVYTEKIHREIRNTIPNIMRNLHSLLGDNGIQLDSYIQMDIAIYMALERYPRYYMSAISKDAISIMNRLRINQYNPENMTIIDAANFAIFFTKVDNKLSEIGISEINAFVDRDVNAIKNRIEIIAEEASRIIIKPSYLGSYTHIRATEILANGIIHLVAYVLAEIFGVKL